MEFAPEAVDKFNAHGDVAEQFAAVVMDLGESAFWVGVFPEFTDIMKESAREEEVAIKGGVNGTQGIGSAHHLGDVFDKSTAAGVVVAFGCGGAAEVFAMGLEEVVAECVQAWVGDGIGEFLDLCELCVLVGAKGRIAVEKTRERILIRTGENKIFGVEAEAIEGPIGGEEEHIGEFHVLSLLKAWVVFPDFDGKVARGIGETQFQVRFAIFGCAQVAGLQLG